MSIQKKSLISALKTTKKANVASLTEVSKGENRTSMRPAPHSVISSKKAAIQPKQFLSGKKAVQPKQFLSGKKMAQGKSIMSQKKVAVE